MEKQIQVAGSSQITKQGKVHIPKDLRDKLCWKHKDTILLIHNEEKGTIILCKAEI